MQKTTRKVLFSFGISLGVLLIAWIGNRLFPDLCSLPSMALLSLIVLLAAIWLTVSILIMATIWVFKRRGLPESEAIMIGRLMRLTSFFVLILAVAYGYGKLGTFGTLFSLFGGMVLGWSLQAPVSGFAAWILVSLKRPFRPGDRIQLPTLALTGDVKDIGPMYVILDQVGGTIGSEEAVGRDILIPNAMLFSQVVINYTVCQEAAYMLDEVVARITYDSDMEMAEKILLDAAREITKDIIAKTKTAPYIRSDLYDYGVYLRLRYQTSVQDRARIAYEINKRILVMIQQTPTVDLAIPYIYSYRAGMERREEDPSTPNGIYEGTSQVAVDRIPYQGEGIAAADIQKVALSIANEGLLQPVVLRAVADGQSYEILGGHLRFLACKQLGWKTIPAIVRPQVTGRQEPPDTKR
ncbi:MAG: mechanosensitive ion channel [Verrucomicrobia bacterium]|nr:mechanosensitive ion channel [Verrucomicrobiota bacterium]